MGRMHERCLICKLLHPDTFNNNNIRRCGLLVELTSQLQVIQYIKHYIKAVGSG